MPSHNALSAASRWKLHVACVLTKTIGNPMSNLHTEMRVPLLAIWGKGDPAFVPAGAEAYKPDLSNAVVKFVDSGHFALETRKVEIAGAVLDFFGEACNVVRSVIDPILFD